MTTQDDTPRTETAPTSRRAVLTGAAAGAAGLAFAQGARAQVTPSETGTRFADQVVLITGGTSGIGRKTAEEFAREGATVVFCGRRAEPGAEVAQGVTDAGGIAEYRQVDVKDTAALRSFVDQTVERHGRIDVAFNNAGIAIPPGPMEETTEEAYREIIDTNEGGVFWAMHAQLPHMKAQGGGVIINTSSTFGSHAPNTQVAYGATKGAIDIMTEGVSKEVAADGIRVLAVAPGAIVETDLFRFLGRDWTPEEVEFFGSLHAVGRAGYPIDVARVVLMLASQDAGFMTGHTISVDGQILAA